MTNNIQIRLIKCLGECIGFLRGIQYMDNAYEAQLKIQEFYEKIDNKFDAIIKDLHAESTMKESAS